MLDPGNIAFIPRQLINISKWDECIEKSSNGLIYAYSFYLDHMARYWDALVLNDYEAVMPLTRNRKYGIHYLYQPFLTAQLGIFGKKAPNFNTEQFLHAVPRKFKYWDICLNHQNIFETALYPVYSRINYVLDLEKPYTELNNAYREQTRRNIKKAEQQGCRVVKDFDAEKVIRLALNQMKSYSKESGENVTRFRKLFQILHSRGQAITYGIQIEENELLASCIFFFSNNRAYYILVGNHPNGKTTGASHALIDAFIRDYAGKNMLLDFEGSDIPNLAFFYSSFGAREEKYPAIRMNRLPLLLRWVKK